MGGRCKSENRAHSKFAHSKFAPLLHYHAWNFCPPPPRKLWVQALPCRRPNLSWTNIISFQGRTNPEPILNQSYGLIRTATVQLWFTYVRTHPFTIWFSRTDPESIMPAGMANVSIFGGNYFHCYHHFSTKIVHEYLKGEFFNFSEIEKNYHRKLIHCPLCQLIDCKSYDATQKWHWLSE